MKEKLWDLLEETLNIKYSGGFDIMDYSLDLVLDILCEEINQDKEKLKADIDLCWKQSIEKYGHRLEKQEMMKETFFGYHFNRIRAKALLGEYK